VLNVSSVYAFSPVPNQAVYAAAKAFLLSWTRTLALELHGTGVCVSVLCPGITQTRFRSRAGMKEKKSAFSMTAEAVAAIAVKGMLRGKTVIVPGWHNWLYTSLASCLPAWVLGRFTLWFNKKRGIAGTAH
jgi:short-subunit dehydrogenase